VRGVVSKNVEPEALELHISRRREPSTRGRNRDSGTFLIGWDFLWATASSVSLRIVNYLMNREKMYMQTYVCSRRLS
jgi:hypothetical protein